MNLDSIDIIGLTLIVVAVFFSLSAYLIKMRNKESELRAISTLRAMIFLLGAIVVFVAYVGVSAYLAILGMIIVVAEMFSGYVIRKLKNIFKSKKL